MAEAGAEAGTETTTTSEPITTDTLAVAGAASEEDEKVPVHEPTPDPPSEATEDAKVEGPSASAESAAGDAATSSSESKPDVNLTGVWILTESQNVDTFLKEQGIGWFKRKIAEAISLTITIEHNGDELTMTAVAMGLKTVESSTLTIGGDAFTQELPTGDTLTGKMTWSDDRQSLDAVLTHDQTGAVQNVKRYIDEEGRFINEITNENGTSMVRIFERQKTT